MAGGVVAAFEKPISPVLVALTQDGCCRTGPGCGNGLQLPSCRIVVAVGCDVVAVGGLVEGEVSGAGVDTPQPLDCPAFVGELGEVSVLVVAAAGGKSTAAVRRLRVGGGR